MAGARGSWWGRQDRTHAGTGWHSPSTQCRSLWPPRAARPSGTSSLPGAGVVMGGDFVVFFVYVRGLFLSTDKNLYKAYMSDGVGWWSCDGGGRGCSFARKGAGCW